MSPTAIGARRWRQCLCVSASGFAIAGPLGLLMVLPVLLMRARPADAVFDDLDRHFESGPRSRTRDRIDDLCLQLRESRIDPAATDPVLPLVDIVAAGRQCDKLGALRIISANFEPDFAPTLHLAAVSPDAAVKVMAATVLAKLKKSKTDRMLALEERFEAAGQPPELRLNIAAALVDIARSGLLDDNVAADHLSMARLTVSSGLPNTYAVQSRYREVLAVLEQGEREHRYRRAASDAPLDSLEAPVYMYRCSA